ncbi:hypothetical protein [Chromatium okenii]|nr:hypothetical protein [Chromatium okenii]
MEPDTFAILEGRASTHGTVHLVTEKFDEVRLWQSRPNCHSPTA